MCLCTVNCAQLRLPLDCTQCILCLTPPSRHPAQSVHCCHALDVTLTQGQALHYTLYSSVLYSIHSAVLYSIHSAVLYSIHSAVLYSVHFGTVYSIQRCYVLLTIILTYSTQFFYVQYTDLLYKVYSTVLYNIQYSCSA